MDQGQRQAILMAILAFNITFVLYTLLFNAGLPPLRWQFTVTRLLLGLLISGGVATGGFFASRMTQ